MPALDANSFMILFIIKEQKQTLTERDKYTFSRELTAIYS